MMRGMRKWTGFGATSVIAAIALVGATLAPGAGAAPAPQITIAPGTLNLGVRRVGTFFKPKAIVVANTGSTPLTIKSIAYHGGDESDFSVGTDCFASSHPATLAPNASCLIDVVFAPEAVGKRSATLSIGNNAASSPQRSSPTATSGAAPSTFEPRTTSSTPYATPRSASGHGKSSALARTSNATSNSPPAAPSAPVAGAALPDRASTYASTPA